MLNYLMAKRLKRIGNFLTKFIMVVLIPVILVVCSITLLLSIESKSYAKAIFEQPRLITENTNTQFVEDIRKIANKKIKKQIEAQDNALAKKMEAAFARYGGHMRGLAKIIIKNAKKCGGDPKIIFAVGGNESGFGRVPYKLYNPFGYLDKVQYSSWVDAVTHLSCKISRQHLVPCNNDLVCFINRYGGTDTHKERWLSNVRFFISLLN